MTTPESKPLAIRLLHAWNAFPKGHVFTDMPGTQSEAMVTAGQAEWVNPKLYVSPMDRMMRSEDGVTKKKKGR